MYVPLNGTAQVVIPLALDHYEITVAEYVLTAQDSAFATAQRQIEGDLYHLTFHVGVTDDLGLALLR
jgi:hypothetical protein